MGEFVKLICISVSTSSVSIHYPQIPSTNTHPPMPQAGLKTMESPTKWGRSPPTVVNNNCTVTINYNLCGTSAAPRNGTSAQQDGGFDNGCPITPSTNNFNQTETNANKSSQVDKKNSSRTGYIPSSMANAKTAKIEDLDASFGANSTATSRTETLFTAVEHPRRRLATDTDLLRFIRNTTEAIWRQTDISDSQMQDIAHRYCAEARPSTQNELDREVATWTLDYFQRRMERCLECLETTFQGTTSLDEEVSPMPRPARREHDLKILKSVGPVFSDSDSSPQRKSLLDDHAIKPRTHVYEDIERPLGKLVTSEANELTKELEVDASKEARTRRPLCRPPSLKLPKERQWAALGDKYSVLNEGDDTNPSMAHHTNEEPVEEIETSTQVHPRFSTDGLKSKYASEEDISEQSSSLDTPIDTAATPTFHNVGHSPTNQSDGRTCIPSDLPNNHHIRPKSIGMIVLPSEQTSTRPNPEAERQSASTQKVSPQPRRSVRSFVTQGLGGLSHQRGHKSESCIEPENSPTKPRGVSEKHL